MIYGLWHGGNSYTEPSPEDAEEFPSIEAAKQTCIDRYDNTGRWAPGVVETPGVDQDSWMRLYHEDPRSTHDPVPVRLIEMGPRGGWKVSKV